MRRVGYDLSDLSLRRSDLLEKVFGGDVESAVAQDDQLFHPIRGDDPDLVML